MISHLQRDSNLVMVDSLKRSKLKFNKSFDFDRIRDEQHLIIFFYPSSQYQMRTG